MSSDDKLILILGQYQYNRIEDAIYVQDPSFVLYSPRFKANIIGLNDDGVALIIDRKQTVYYVTKEKNIDPYLFYFKCRVNKNCKPYFCFGEYKTIAEIEKNSRQIYCLVSGEKLPTDISREEKLLIQRYMIYGLVHFHELTKRGLGDSVISNSKTKSEYISSNKHSFGKYDGCLIDVSSLFMGMLIDYYQISSGVTNENAQRSFIGDPEYRRIVYETFRKVFFSFMNKNSNDHDRNNLSPEYIIQKSVEILENYIKE